MKINHTIKILTLSEFLLNAGFSFFAPIFAIFVTRQIPGGTLETIGFAAAITQIVKSVLEIPIARYLDKNHGEYDDFYSLVTGRAFLMVIPFMYMFISSIPMLYFVSALMGIGLALSVPPWNAIFTRHIDKLQENMEWSFVSVSIGISGAAATALGGIVAETYGFKYVFLLGGILAIASSWVQIGIFKDLKAVVKPGAVKPVPDKI